MEAGKDLNIFYLYDSGILTNDELFNLLLKSLHERNIEKEFVKWIENYNNGSEVISSAG